MLNVQDRLVKVAFIRRLLAVQQPHILLEVIPVPKVPSRVSSWFGDLLDLRDLLLLIV
jgi:hypothetical protein